MKDLASILARSPAPFLLACLATAQIPDGWYVYGAFSPNRGKIGVFASHPRTAGKPSTITNLQGDLKVTGSSCILYRKSDGAILVGERAPTDSSVDLHVIHLNGLSVFVDASFSLGTGGPCCGEIPQMGLLGDDRVVVAVTDVSAGPLKNYKTTSYGWQGVGIVDTQSGLITPITISNGAKILDVFNGLAVAPDEKSVFVGTYVSATRGDIWQVPIAGGAATVVASVPAGLSNLGFDRAGELWVTTLDSQQGLFRIDLAKKTVTKVPQSNGSLNGIAFEAATGNLSALSANAGNPARSVFWMEPSGKHHQLSNPGYGSLSGIAINPNPEVIGAGTPGTATYAFKMPNPGGLPLLGSSTFSLTVEATGPARPGLAAFGTGRLAQPVPVLGALLHLDPAKILVTVALPFPSPMTLALPIPKIDSLVGVPFFVQSFHLESGTVLSSSPALEVSGPVSGTAKSRLGAVVVVAVGCAAWFLCDSGRAVSLRTLDGDVTSALAVAGAPGRTTAATADSPTPSPTEPSAKSPTPSPADAPAESTSGLPVKPVATHVRVVVTLADDVRGLAVPEPELLRLDAHGQPWPVAAQGGGKPRHPALTVAAPTGRKTAERQAVRTFVVETPGRYVAAWHLWMQVPGTRTWRTCRGRGPELLVSGDGGRHEIPVRVGAMELQLDRCLDAPARSNHTTISAKDGE